MTTTEETEVLVRLGWTCRNEKDLICAEHAGADGTGDFRIMFAPCRLKEEVCDTLRTYDEEAFNVLCELSEVSAESAVRTLQGFRAFRALAVALGALPERII